jgi:hypothetical protein
MAVEQTSRSATDCRDAGGRGTQRAYVRLAFSVGPSPSVTCRAVSRGPQLARTVSWGHVRGKPAVPPAARFRTSRCKSAFCGCGAEQGRTTRGTSVAHPSLPGSGRYRSACHQGVALRTPVLPGSMGDPAKEQTFSHCVIRTNIT